jgi:hypothetical protein
MEAALKKIRDGIVAHPVDASLRKSIEDFLKSIGGAHQRVERPARPAFHSRSATHLGLRACAAIEPSRLAAHLPRCPARA